MIFMNLNTWNSLSDKDQAVINRVALKLENESIRRFDRLGASETKRMLGIGVKFTHFSSNETAQLEQLWAEGVWEIARRTAPKKVDALREVARKGGLSE